MSESQYHIHIPNPLLPAPLPYYTSAYLFLDIHALHTNNTCKDGILDKILVRHHFGAGKCAERVDELASRAFKVANGHQVHTFVSLQSVSSVPITPLFNQFFEFVNIGSYHRIVVKKEADSYQCKNNIDSCAKCN